MRRVAWFSSGAASAVAAKLSKPDVIEYCDTASEDADNMRFLDQCQVWFGQEIIKLKSDKYDDIWDVWQKRRYISGIAGAPCTGLLKVEPRLKFQKPGDVHIFGYTADSHDSTRAENLREAWPDLQIETPLIDRGITKAGCLDLIMRANIKPPRVYAMGFPNANCIPCCKASSPSYWALVRKEFPEQFKRFAKLSRELGVKAAVVKGERVFVDDIDLNQPVTKALAPECDFLCAIADQEMIDL